MSASSAPLVRTRRARWARSVKIPGGSAQLDRCHGLVGLFDWISPIDVEKELAEKQNLAVAIVVGSFIVGVCFIIGRAVGS